MTYNDIRTCKDKKNKVMKNKKQKTNRKCMYCNLPAKAKDTFLCAFHYKSSRAGKLELKRGNRI